MNWSRTTLRLILLALLALGLRVAAVGLLESYREPFTYEHGEIAENLLAGRGFSVAFLGSRGPTSQQAPFYPYLLAAAYGVFGVGSASAFLAVHLLQCLVAAATVLCVVWLSWSLLPKRRAIGWIAGLLTAVHPVHVYMVTHLQVAVWATFLLTLLVAIAVSPRSKRWSGALLMGLVIGALLLVEPIFALVTPLVALAVGWRSRSNSNPKRQRGSAASPRQGSSLTLRVTKAPSPPYGRVALMAAVAMIVIAPWLWRNYRVHGEFVFVKSTFGYAFWQGNNPISQGTDKVPKPSVEQLRQAHDGTLAGMQRAVWEARQETLYIDDVLLKPHGYREFTGLGEPARCRLLGRRAWQWVREQPLEYARLCGNRLRYFLLVDETNPKAAHWIYRLATVLWLPVCLLGLWLTRSHWRRLWPTYAIFAVVTLFHTLTITSARFRIPIEPLSLVWAAAAVHWALSPFFLGHSLLDVGHSESPETVDVGTVDVGILNIQQGMSNAEGTRGITPQLPASPPLRKVS